jgi:hypothetical protein
MSQGDVIGVQSLSFNDDGVLQWLEEDEGSIFRCVFSAVQ